MKKSRFIKGQPIFRIEVFQNRPVRVHAEIVKSCGLKKLKLESDCRWGNTYKPDAHAGHMDNLIKLFHGTFLEAEEEIEKFNTLK